MMDPRCEAALLRMDLLLDGALEKDEAAEVEAHLGGCAACRTERETRLAIQTRLRRAVRRPVEMAGLERRVLASVRRPAYRWQTMAAAAVVVLGLAGAVAYELGVLRISSAQEDSYLALVEGKVSHIMRVGLLDHIHCAAFRKMPKPAPPVDEVVKDLGAKYRPVVEAVRAHVPADFRVVLAHECRAHGRRFVHLSMVDGEGRIVSLVLSKKKEGETFANSPLRRVAGSGGVPVFTEGLPQYSIAGFETAGFLAYVVSDLGDQQNERLAVAIAGPVRSFFDGLG